MINFATVELDDCKHNSVLSFDFLQKGFIGHLNV